MAPTDKPRASETNKDPRRHARSPNAVEEWLRDRGNWFGSSGKLEDVAYVGLDSPDADPDPTPSPNARSGNQTR